MTAEQGSVSGPTVERGPCLWCEEPVSAGERAEATVLVSEGGPTMRWRHWECAARAALGSVGHQMGRCSCHGGTEEDPPGLTRRQAAQAAWDLARERPESVMQWNFREAEE